VHGSEGLDEISISGKTSVLELLDNKILEYEIHPEDFGLNCAPIKAIQTRTCEDNKKIMKDVLDGLPGGPRDIVLLNAAAAIRVSGKASTLQEGVALAQKSIDSGSAKKTLQKLIDITNKTQ